MKPMRDQQVTARTSTLPVSPDDGAERASATAGGAANAVRLLAFGLVVLLPAGLAWGGWAWLTRTPGFHVRRVHVTGCERVPAQEIASASGAIGTNAFALDLEDVRARILAHPWVEDVSVRRALPHELRVHVTERQPVAVEISGGVTRVLDERGLVLSEAPLEGLSLPEIRGIASAPEAERASLRALAAATLQALRVAAPALHARAEGLEVAASGKLVLQATDCPPIWLSGPGSADEVAAWSRRENGIRQAIGRAAWVDARWRDRLYVMPAASAAGVIPSTRSEDFP